MWDLKYDTNELTYETETDSQTQRIDLWLPRGKGVWGRDGLGVWDQQIQTVIQRMDKQQGPTVQYRELYSISSVIKHNGKKKRGKKSGCLKADQNTPL